MKIKIFFLWIVFLGGLNFLNSGDETRAQTPWFENVHKDRSILRFRDLFFYETYTTPTESPDSVQFTFFAKIANDMLQFILRDSIYFAQYELTIAIKNDREETVAGRIKRKEISADSYSITNDRNLFTQEKLVFFLVPGEYDLFIELLDLETRQPIRQKEKIVLPDFYSDPFTTTELLFFPSQGEVSFMWDEHFPALPAAFSPSDGPFRALFFICSNTSPINLELKQTILDSDAQPVYEYTYQITPNLRIQPVDLQINEVLAFGQYTLSVEITDGNTETTLESPFYIRWKTHTTHIPNLDQAIQTIRYVMAGNQWNDLQNRPIEEQKTILEQFWKEKDPNPDTENNELEEEYYRRVAFTNENFSSWDGGKDGWETDRGRIYIIYGPPSNVDTPSTPARESSHYEIWYYGTLQKRFVFMDRYGTGDYRLVTEE